MFVVKGPGSKELLTRNWKKAPRPVRHQTLHRETKNLISWNIPDIKKAKQMIWTIPLAFVKQVLGLLHCILNQAIGLREMRATSNMMKIPFFSKPSKFSTGKLWAIVGQQPAWNSMNRKVVRHLLNNKWIMKDKSRGEFISNQPEYESTRIKNCVDCQSNISGLTRDHGSSGTGWTRSGSFCWCGLALLQGWHKAIVESISSIMEGQYTISFALLVVASAPRCPFWRSWMYSLRKEFGITTLRSFRLTPLSTISSYLIGN